MHMNRRFTNEGIYDGTNEFIYKEYACGCQVGL